MLLQKCQDDFPALVQHLQRTTEGALCFFERIVCDKWVYPLQLRESLPREAELWVIDMLCADGNERCLMTATMYLLEAAAPGMLQRDADSAVEQLPITEAEVQQRNGEAVVTV